jgi:predicted PurR-regulated permease PerM
MATKTSGAAVWRIGLHAASLAAIILVLWSAASFLKLLAIALILSAALQSPVSSLARRGWRRGIAIATVCVAAASLLVVTIAILVPRVVPQLQRAADAAPDVVADVQDSTEYRWLEKHEVSDRAAKDVRKYAGRAVGVILAAAIGAVSLGADVITVAAMTVFILVSGPVAWSWLLSWVHPRRRRRVRRLGEDSRRAIAGYVAGALIMGAVAGLVTGITTALVGVPYFLALAVLAAVLGIVPFIGALVSGVVVVATTLVTTGTTSALIVLGVFVAYQQLEGAVFAPLIQRYTTSMNPLVVLLAVLLGMSAGGVFGGVVALPAAAAAQVVANDALAHRRRAWRNRSNVATHPEPLTHSH